MKQKRLYLDIDPQEVKKVIGRVKDVFLTYDTYTNKLFDYCQNQKLVIDSSPKILAINLLFSKALKTFYAIYELCKEGYGSDAFILFRSLMEIRISILYIWHTDGEIAERFFRYEDFAKHDYRIPIKDRSYQYEDPCQAMGIEDNELNEMKKKYDEYVAKYGKKIKHSWSGQSIVEMIRSLPDQISEKEFKDYDSFYRLCSFHVHSNIISVKNKISLEGVFEIAPNLQDINPIFPASVHYIIELIKLWAEFMKAKLPDDLIHKFEGIQHYSYVKFKDSS